MRPHRSATALVFAVATTLFASAASAQADPMERARKAFADGTEAENRGDCVAALERFEEVVAVKETPAVRLRIGRCHEKLGKLLAATRDYERAKELAQSDAQALEVATRVADDLSKRIPRVEVKLVDAPASTLVKLDDAELPSGARNVPVDPGRHRVTATAEGFEPFEQSFELAEGRTQALTITLRKRDVEAPPPPPPPTEPVAEPFPWLPVILYGGGAIAVGVGIPLLVTSVSDDAALDEKCFEASGAISEDRDPCLRKTGVPYTKAQQAEITSERDSINTRQILGWSLVGVGVAAAGVATVILVTSTGEEEPAVATAPALAPGYAGWSASGRF